MQDRFLCQSRYLLLGFLLPKPQLEGGEVGCGSQRVDAEALLLCSSHALPQW